MLDIPQKFFTWLFNSFKSMLAGNVEQTLNDINKYLTDMPMANLNSEKFVSVYDIAFAFSIYLGVPTLIIALILVVLRNDSVSTMFSKITWYIKLLLVCYWTPFLYIVALEISGNMAEGLSDASLTGKENWAESMLGYLSSPGISIVGITLDVVIMIVTTLIYLFALAIAVLPYIVALMIPLTYAIHGVSNAKVATGAFRFTLSLVAVTIFAKPAMILALVAGSWIAVFLPDGLGEVAPKMLVTITLLLTAWIPLSIYGGVRRRTVVFVKGGSVFASTRSAGGVATQLPESRTSKVATAGYIAAITAAQAGITTASGGAASKAAASLGDIEKARVRRNQQRRNVA